MKTAKNGRNHEFVDDSIVMEREAQGIEILPGPQIVGYNPRKRQKWPKIRVLLMPR